MGMKIAWGITGAGHYLKESYEASKRIKEIDRDIKITTFISAAGEEVSKMYGIFDGIRKISPGGYMEEIFTEREQGKSFPKAGRLSLGKYDLAIISPTTSNTVAKIVCGISDSLITNVVSQAMKGDTLIYILPTDTTTKDPIVTKMPYTIDRSKCEGCEDCIAAKNCPEDAILDQIDLLRCTGCGICKDLCEYDAISGGRLELHTREIDRRNILTLREMKGITVLGQIGEIEEVVKKICQ
jgi:dihydromethanopterin reductase (acceptor)